MPIPRQRARPAVMGRGWDAAHEVKAGAAGGRGRVSSGGSTSPSVAALPVEATRRQCRARPGGGLRGRVTVRLLLGWACSGKQALRQAAGFASVVGVRCAPPLSRSSGVQRRRQENLLMRRNGVLPTRPCAAGDVQPVSSRLPQGGRGGAWPRGACKSDRASHQNISSGDIATARTATVTSARNLDRQAPSRSAQVHAMPV